MMKRVILLYRVGMPAKSGVGGGIIAIVPGEMSIRVWSPALNKTGNSLAGTAALEVLVERVVIPSSKPKTPNE